MGPRAKDGTQETVRGRLAGACRVEGEGGHALYRGRDEGGHVLMIIIKANHSEEHATAQPEGWPKALICCFTYLKKMLLALKKLPEKNWLLMVLCFK